MPKKVTTPPTHIASPVELERINNSFSENALKMMKKRYLQQKEDGSQETPAEMFHRIAHALAEVERKYGKDDKFIEQVEREFFEIMMRKEFTPAGRTVTNAGSDTPVVPNCIVLHIDDSMEGIFQTLKEAALLQQLGAGLGFDFSSLRPAMTPTKRTKGVASGPVSFLKIYNEAFGTIKQQGRHGANMAMMQIDHPDVLDFIRAKEVEGELRNFNISVKVTDEFMKALIERPDTQWYCQWKGQKTKPHKILRAPNGAVIGYEEIDITVKELFDEIVKYAWLNGEPGIVFIDEVNRTNPLPGLGPIHCSNPCITGDTLIATEKGFIKMKELVEKYANSKIAISVDQRLPKSPKISLMKSIAVNKNNTFVENNLILEFPTSIEKGEMVRAFKTGIKPVYKLITKSGYEIEATADHKIFTPKGKIELLKLKPGDKIFIQSNEGLWSTSYDLPFKSPKINKGKNGHIYHYNFPTKWSKELGQVLGWLIGDGWLRDKEKEYAVGFTFSKNDVAVMNYFKKILNTWYQNSQRKEILRKNGVYHLIYNSKNFVEFFKQLGVKAVKAKEKEVPSELWRAPREAVIGFLQGIFSSDGTINIYEKNQTRYIRLTSKSQKLLKQIQILLINFGIKSIIYDRSRPQRMVFGYKNDGILYELQISKSNIATFIEKIGFIGNHYNSRLLQLKNNSYYSEKFEDEIKEIKYIGEKEVYDLTESTTHSFIANGIVISNCGEQFLHPYDNCNLGSINLAQFVKNNEIDWERLKYVTRTAVRLMDNVIDIFEFPVKQLEEMAQGNRRIGLGIMGFADMLYQLNIGYNSKEGIDLAEKIMSTIQETAHQMSQELAEEKGIFPNWHLSIYKDKGIKMRNTALTTVAPTGSISMMFDTSSGIEPNFALSYIKQDKDGHQYHYFNPYFEKALKDYKFSDEEIQRIKDEVIKKGTIQHLENIPEKLKKTFVVALDISAEDHIRMQSAFQKHVDNSISKTINFPFEATMEDVKKGFILAWKLKCKSTTVYRNGSREVQILNVGTGENIKSPTELGKKTETKNIEAKNEIKEESKKEELNLKMDKNRIEPRKRPEVMSGKTYKVKTGYGNLYITINNDENGVPFEVFATIGKSGGFFQEQSEGICRLISLSLRAGVKIEEIIDNLKGIRGPMPTITEKGTILSLPDAIGKILEEHVKSTNGKNHNHNSSNELKNNEKAKLPEAKGEVLNFNQNPKVEILVENSENNSEDEILNFGQKSIADFGYAPGCPECGTPLVLAEGCVTCKNCGYSRCG